MRTIIGSALVTGRNEGKVLALDEPLSFSGGLNSITGRVSDRWHPQHGACLTGTVLVMRAGRGSSSGSAVLAEALRRGTGPATIVLSERDGIVSAGAIVARRLYGIPCPIVMVAFEDREVLAQADRVQIEATADGATLRPF